MRIIQENKLELFIEGERENSLIDSVMYHNEEDTENHCECAGDGDCEISFGFYFGTSDSYDPVFCPRHYFCGNGYEIKPTK